MKRKKEEKLIGYITMGSFVILFVWGVFDVITRNIEFIFDRFFLAGIALLAFFVYRKMRLSLPVLLVGLIPFTMHSLGFYHHTYFGLPFDHYLHFFAGLAIGLPFTEYLSKKKEISRPAIIALVVCIVAGIGSFMEITEYFGKELGGEGGGLLFYGAGDYGEWDNAIRDMICNTLGGLLASMLVFWKRR